MYDPHGTKCIPSAEPATMPRILSKLELKQPATLMSHASMSTNILSRFADTLSFGGLVKGMHLRVKDDPAALAVRRKHFRRHDRLPLAPPLLLLLLRCEVMGCESGLRLGLGSS